MDRIKILIVEDSLTQAMQLQHILAENNYDATIASNGREALMSISESKPLIVISDIVMPEMDGYELCRQIKSSESCRDIFLILLTSLSQPQDVIRALQCGADKFITKPYDEKQLLLTIQHLNESVGSQNEIKEEIHVSYEGEKYSIYSNRLQILSLLISTYETAVAKNLELIGAQDELRRFNKNLEQIVKDRTESLRIEIDERKTAEAGLEKKSEEIRMISQQLMQAEKLATVGELAASIAHELNNPLAIISLRIESLLEKTPEGSPHRRELDIMEQEIGRMGNLVANLLEFSRRGRQEISTLDVCEEIEKTLELIYYHLRKYNISIMRQFSPGVPRIHADRQQLRQLFLNLFTNAVDAMPHGGMLTIVVAVIPEEKQLRIEIADTGSGIPPEILSKVTEPFYSTKPEGKGTGLGLAICRRIIQAHHGEIEITSDAMPGKGTKVCFTLPFLNNSTVDYLSE